jgi:hypothetical protein
VRHDGVFVGVCACTFVGFVYDFFYSMVTSVVIPRSPSGTQARAEQQPSCGHTHRRATVQQFNRATKTKSHQNEPINPSEPQNPHGTRAFLPKKYLYILVFGNRAGTLPLGRERKYTWISIAQYPLTARPRMPPVRAFRLSPAASRTRSRSAPCSGYRRRPRRHRCGHDPKQRGGGGGGCKTNTQTQRIYIHIK